MAKYDDFGFIAELDKNEIFVFGSNGQGAHLGGAAATAVQKFGATMIIIDSSTINNKGIDT